MHQLISCMMIEKIERIIIQSFVINRKTTENYSLSKVTNYETNIANEARLVCLWHSKLDKCL